MNEAFRVVCPGVLQGALALFEDTLGAAVMDVAWGEHGDPGMSMLLVVPREEGPAERDRGVDINVVDRFRPDLRRWYQNPVRDQSKTPCM